jgi:succinyl-diaminopimelate desuccinylase
LNASDSTVRLAIELINKQSITPEDAGCQTLIASRLAAAGFHIERLNVGEVSNLWARRGVKAPLLCFAGHTDVVPTGNIEEWDSNPFEAQIRDGRLYGRGAADMKGGLSAMITAAERFVAQYPNFDGSIAFLITSDEEGIAVNGTRAVVEILNDRNESIDWCVVGEPSSKEFPGDVIRIGRRGSLTGALQVQGKQGHIAYAHLANNPIRQFAPALADLNETVWDKGNEHFPPTTFEFAHLQSSSGADNVIPEKLEAKFNLRYSTEWNNADLQDAVENVLLRHNMDYQISWHLSGKPFLTEPGKLMQAVVQAVHDISAVDAELSTGGGTSDGRFIAPHGADVIEIGLVNATIHMKNENVVVDHLPLLSKIYERILQRLLIQT